MSFEKDHVAQRVLKRAEISRITRNLKSRLGLASFKAKRGLHNMSFETIEKSALSQEAEQASSPSLTLSKRRNMDNISSSPPRLQNPPIKRKRNDFEEDEYYDSMQTTPSKFSKIMPPNSSSSGIYTSPMTPGHNNNLNQSPPSTPPRRNEEQQGADLLMYLATSPSPAQKKKQNLIPRTPTNMNSSPIIFQTPQQFNLNDYLNIPTPSPAQKKGS